MARDPNARGADYRRSALRIAIANWTAAVVGGQETYLHAVIPSLTNAGHEVLFLYEQPAWPGAPTIFTADGRLDTIAVNSVNPRDAVADLKRWAPDVVYVHGLGSGRLEARLLAQFRCVLFPHGYYGTCATGTKRFAFPHVLQCHRTLEPSCLVLNYLRRCGGVNPWRLGRFYALQTGRRARLRRFDAIIVASQHMREEFVRHAVNGPRIQCVPYPPSDIVPLSTLPQARAVAGRLLYAGRLTPLKGVDYLIRAIPMAEIALGRTLSVSIAGDGPARTQLEHLARSMGVAADFLGFVDRYRTSSLMREADVVVVPSLWPEPFGLVGLEAAALGTPSVGFAIGAIPEWLRPGETGELAPGNPPTPEGLATALTQALSSPAHLQRLREVAWNWARTVTMDSHITAIEKVFEEVVRTP